MASESGKKTKGKQKIEVKKIEKEDDKLVTYSKRRAGICKKASDLIILTDAEIAFVAYSPSGKPYTFAHPSMEAVTNRFQGGAAANPMEAAQQRVRIHELNERHCELIEQRDLEKEREKELKRKINGEDTKGWWDAQIDDLNVEQMKEMVAAFHDVQTRLINNLMLGSDGGGSSSAHPQPHNPASFDSSNPPNFW